MENGARIAALLVDIGGVLLTNGWDHLARARAATEFHLDLAEMTTRHEVVDTTFELGKLTLDDYLNAVVFYQDRPFTRATFRAFMFSQSQPQPHMITLIRALKAQYGLKIVVVSNEGRELNAHRIHAFHLDAFVDAFISSCFVHLRKPDADIFRLALDIAQVPTEQVLLLDNTPMVVEIAQSLGIPSIVHIDYATTCAHLAAVGLVVAD